MIGSEKMCHVENNIFSFYIITIIINQFVLYIEQLIIQPHGTFSQILSHILSALTMNNILLNKLQENECITLPT